MRRLPALLIGAAITAAVIGFTPLAATASGDSHAAPRGVMTVDAVQTFQNAATGGCLDDNNNPGGGLHVQGCNGGQWQKWNVRVWGDGTRELKNTVTGRCIDYYPPANLLRTYACNASTYQSWFVHPLSGGRIAFENQAAGGFCLDDSQYGLRIIQCYWNAYQAWG